MRASFSQEVEFFQARFEDRATFHEAEFSSGSFRFAEFAREANFTGAIFELRMDFRDVVFNGPVRFRNAYFESTDFGNAEFNNGVDFRGLDLSDVTFYGANLTEADLMNTNLNGTNMERSILSRATLSGADLRGAKTVEVAFGDVRIDEDTQFLGHPDEDGNNESSIWDTLSELRSGNYCVYDPRYEGERNSADIDSAKSVYRALEELAGRAARPQLQSACFVNRQDLQRRKYWDSISDSDNPLEWVINGGKWLRAKVARGTLLYGESPWRIIGGSIGFIILAALLYPVGEWLRPVGGEPITYSRILGGEPGLLLESLYFSTLTFTTLGMGDYQPMGLGQVLATLNTALGAVLIALLVFVLGRRAAR